MSRLAGGLLAVAVAYAAAGIVADVRRSIAENDFRAGERLISDYRAKAGVTPEMVEAHSWLGRGALAAKDLAAAERYAAETRKLALDLLRGRKLDDDRRLPTALGASIEVQGQVLAARGQRSEAVDFLNQELLAWRDTSIHERIRKNINLLSLVGKPAPPLQAASWLGAKPGSLQGRPMLIFLWAHWCGDCKRMAPVIARLERTYGPRGLTIIGPTRLYGYAARGEDATPDQELRHIRQVREEYYGGIQSMLVPVGAEIFKTYGVSTTPTLVLVDRRGIVRLYHPGSMKEAELAAQIEGLVAPSS